MLQAVFPVVSETRLGVERWRGVVLAKWYREPNQLFVKSGLTHRRQSYIILQLGRIREVVEWLCRVGSNGHVPFPWPDGNRHIRTSPSHTPGLGGQWMLLMHPSSSLNLPLNHTGNTRFARERHDKTEKDRYPWHTARKCRRLEPCGQWDGLTQREPVEQWWSLKNDLVASPGKATFGSTQRQTLSPALLARPYSSGGPPAIWDWDMPLVATLSCQLSAWSSVKFEYCILLIMSQ
jgi:hypothetical protein